MVIKSGVLMRSKVQTLNNGELFFEAVLLSWNRELIRHLDRVRVRETVRNHWHDQIGLADLLAFYDRLADSLLFNDYTLAFLALFSLFLIVVVGDA